MTLKELKDTVRNLIGRARTEKAIDQILKWARENDQKDLIDDTTLLQARLTKLDRESRLGLLSNSEASISRAKIVHGVLGLLDGIRDDEPTPGQSAKGPPIQDPPTPGQSTQNPPSDNPLSGKVKLLMLTANPADTTVLNLDKEHSIITQKLQKRPEFFQVILKKAVSSTEFREFTQEEKPDILHFSGHGESGKYAGIALQSDDKNEKELILIPGLEALFEFFKRRFEIKIVVLNACHTQDQAAAISQYVEYVIGTNVAIGDAIATAFSTGFYYQLAIDHPMNIEDAFASGRTAGIMKGADKDNFVIYRHGKLIEV